MGSQLIATTRDITASALGPKKLGLHKHPSVQQVVNNVAVVFMSFREIDGFVKVVAFRESLHSSNDRIGCDMQPFEALPTNAPVSVLHPVADCPSWGGHPDRRSVDHVRWEERRVGKEGVSKCRCRWRA